MRIELNENKYEIVVDNNLNIIVSEVGLNKAKGEECLINNKYFTNFEQVFNYLFTQRVKKNFKKREIASLEEVRNDIKEAETAIKTLIGEFNMNDLIKETVNGFNAKAQEMKEKSEKAKKDKGE